MRDRPARVKMCMTREPLGIDLIALAVTVRYRPQLANVGSIVRWTIS
jgi:hypothetical protein